MQFSFLENQISWKFYYYPVDNFLKYEQQQEEDTLLTLWSFHWKKVYKWQTKITTFLNNQPQLSNQFPINSLPSTEKHQVQHFVMIVCCGTIDKIKVQLTHATGVSGKYCLSFCPWCNTAQLIKHLVQLNTPTRGWLTFPFNFKIICVITFSLLK